MNVDARVVSIVGPNEAGKTSWLRALIHLGAAGELGASEWTRGQSAPSGRAIWSRFALDEDDYTALADVPEARKLRWYELWKDRDGQLFHAVLPADAIHRDRKPRERAARLVERAARHRILRDDENPDEPSALAQQLETLNAALGSDNEKLDEPTIEALAAAADALDNAELGNGPNYLQQLSDHLRKLSAHEARLPPKDLALSILDGRVPHFLFFGDEQRDLRSDYDLTVEAETPPAALGNLAELAELDLRALRDAIVAEDFGRAEQLVEDANDCLAARFAESWRQSGVYVRLQRDGTLLRILISATGGGYTGVAERSDGLRAFIALFTFTTLNATAQPPILLVDEAENHLHYDAQADLVRVFSRQRAAAKIIYTTHSAGCLPQDLAGVRLIVPDGAGSSVRNAFWSEGPGFTPLLIGMGASVLAFTPARYAVFTEGGSEVVLLPTLLREAKRSDNDLAYQTVPGLSELNVAQVAGLDLEAAQVACLVDGDAAGGKIRAKLIRGGMPAERIVSLGGRGNGFVLEDMVDAEPYLRAVNTELARSHGEDVLMPMSALSGKNRPRDVKTWCDAAGIPEPNKRAVAYRLLELRTEGVMLTSATRRQYLKKADHQLRAALGVPPELNESSHPATDAVEPR